MTICQTDFAVAMSATGTLSISALQPSLSRSRQTPPMIEEATPDDIAALETGDFDLAAEQSSSAEMDEDNLSYMADPDAQDGLEARRAANDSDSEATNQGMYLEDLTPQALEDEDADPVGDLSEPADEDED